MAKKNIKKAKAQPKAKAKPSPKKNIAMNKPATVKAKASFEAVKAVKKPMAKAPGTPKLDDEEAQNMKKKFFTAPEEDEEEEKAAETYDESGEATVRRTPHMDENIQDYFNRLE